MNYTLIAELITRIGLQATDFIIRKQAANAVVTLEEWKELYGLAAATPESIVTEAIMRLGLNSEDEHVKAVIAMLPK